MGNWSFRFRDVVLDVFVGSRGSPGLVFELFRSGVDVDVESGVVVV